MRGAGRRDWRQEEVRGRRRGGCTYQKKNQHPDKLYAAGYTYRISGPRDTLESFVIPILPITDNTRARVLLDGHHHHQHHPSHAPYHLSQSAAL